MRFLVLFALVFASHFALADAVIFSGNDVKALKYNLDLFGRSKVMGLAADPSSGGGQAAPLGSIGMDYLTGNVYIKTGGGATAWTRVTIASDLTAYIPKSTLTAKGDILVATGSSTPSVRSVGTNGYVLQADSTHATGLSYKETSAAAAASSLVLLDSDKDLAARRIETSAGSDAIHLDDRWLVNTGGALMVDWSGSKIQLYQGAGICNASLSPCIQIESSTTGGVYTIKLPAGVGVSGSVLMSTVASTTSTLSYTPNPVLGVAGTSLGSVGLSGNTSGVVTLRPAAAAGTYDFYFPTSMGSSGEVLTSAGAGAAPTWSTPFTNPMTTANDLIYGGTSGSPQRLAIGTATPRQFLAVSDSLAPSWRSFSAMTTQVFTSGSGTYTTPANVIWLEVEMVGGGGGGQGSGSASRGSGGSGGNTTFSTATANGGVGGSDGTNAAGGGTSGCTLGIPGGNATGSWTAPGGMSGNDGGSSFFGGAGAGGVLGGGGAAAATNSGAGGGGGGVGSAINVGSGGGAGGYCFLRIASPSSSYSYGVGAAGTAGTAGTSGQVGGAGGEGIILVREYYQ